MLEVCSLDAAYGDVQVLWDVSLTVESGLVVSLVGSNGAGKSTLLRTVSGLMKPLRGTIRFEGKDITGAPPWDVTALGIVHVPEGQRLFPGMTVEENLLMGAFRRKREGERPRDSLERMYSLFPRLRDYRRRKASSMSGGEQQMCAICRGLMGDPKLLIIDEMSLGLAPQVVDELADMVVRINSEGVSVLLVEQDVGLALDISRYAYVLSTGRMVMEGPASELLEDERVREAYLGV